MSNEENFIDSARKLFRYYKGLAEKAMDQLSDDELKRKPNEVSNSIMLIVHHMTGNMLSRFTDFLTTDGEKPWRNRDEEFEKDFADRKAMMEAWERGWVCLFNAMDALQPSDLSRVIYIRNEGQTVLEAIQRQLAHYPHHVGQILYQAKAIKGEGFKTLSIPKGQSAMFNQEKFGQDKGRRHFTDDLK